MGINFVQGTSGNPSAGFVDDATSKTLLDIRAHGTLMGNIGSNVTQYDDFTGKAISGIWDVVKGSDAGAANFAVNVATNGTVRGTTGAGATTTMAVNGVQLDGSLNWKANKGNLVFEASVDMAAITTVALFVGFTNESGTLQMPVNGSGTANGLTYNATDCVGFLFDTTMTNANWFCTGQANGVPSTAVNSGLAPVAATFDKLRIEIDVFGNATFFLNSVQIGYLALAVTPTVALAPVVAGFRRAASSTTFDVDFIVCQQLR